MKKTKKGSGSLLPALVAKTKDDRPAHSELGGSNAFIWANCQGSVFLLRQLPPQEETVHTLEGTKQHDILARLLGAFLKFKVTGKRFDENQILDDCSSDDARDALLGCVEAVWIRVLGRTITGKFYGIEEKFDFDHNLAMFGTVDFWVVFIDDRGRRVLVVFDYKNGQKPVKAEKNPQLAYYAISIRKWLREHKKDIDHCIAVIYQPFDFTVEDPFKPTTFSPKQLDIWEKKFYTAARTIYVKKEHKFKLGDYCQFCNARHVCEAYRKELNKNAALKLVDSEVELPDVEMLSPEQRLGIAMSAGKLKDFIGRVYASVLRDTLKGKFKGEAKVIVGRGRRTWNKELTEKAIRTFRKLGYDPADFCTMKLRGIGEVEKRIGRETVERFVKQGTGRPILVSADDEREAYRGGQELLDFSEDDDD